MDAAGAKKPIDLMRAASRQPAATRKPEMMQAAIADVTARVRARSQPSREKYLGRIEAMRRSAPHRGALGCANLAHGFAA
jgi:hypothetical protein